MILNIIEKCTKINPAERYDNVLELSNELKSLHDNRQVEEKSSFTYRQLILPGFRTHTAWKMLISVPVYLFIIWLSLSLVVENTFGLPLWIQRFFFLLMFLSIICGTCNYMNIHKYFPLCTHKHRIIRFIGIILLDIMLAATLFITMVIILSIFFPT